MPTLVFSGPHFLLLTEIFIAENLLTKSAIYHMVPMCEGSKGLMTSSQSTLLGRLSRALVAVSCQATDDSPLAATPHIVALARAAVAGGASAVRIEGVANVTAVRHAVGVPIIGIVKSNAAADEAFITVRRCEVEALSAAGADIIAFDATRRRRPEPLAEVVAAIKAEHRVAMADISTLAEAEIAMGAGAEFVGTTLSGYTDYSPKLEGPDFELMSQLATARLPFVAEGRIWHPAEARRAIELGALFVVVGSAITRPDHITRRYAEAVTAAARPSFIPEKSHD